MKARIISGACALIVVTLFAGCMTLGWQTEEPTPDPGLEKAGEVTVEQRIWNLLFLQSPEQRRSLFLEEAEVEARRVYGEDAVISRPRFETQWSPLSLVLALDMLGYVEEGSLSVDVLRPVPPAPPPPPKPLPAPSPAPVPKIVVTYPIEPTDRFSDNAGYVSLEYRTLEQAKEIVKKRLERRKAKPEALEREFARIAEGGEVIVNIGRQVLSNANTKWFDFEISVDETVVYRRSGQEGVPNVRGRDGNWWNIVTLPVENPIAQSIEVTVSDLQLESIYRFSVRRLETKL